tara:strand:+ start:280 stop:813 length:534 start_codon:yes stop_codon:yes gene_type:complete
MKGVNMKNLLDFLDGYVLEKKLYWQVQTIYTTTRCEIEWQQGSKSKWLIRPAMEKNWIETTSTNLIELLSSKQINLIDFEEQLRYSLLQQVAYAKLFIEKGEQLFGEQTISSAVEANKEFVKSVTDAIQSIALPQATNHKKPELAQSGKKDIKKKNSKPKTRKSFLRLLDEQASYRT